VIVTTYNQHIDPARPVTVPSGGFHLTLSSDMTEPVIRIVGELDARTSAMFDRAYDDAAERDPERIIVDMSRMGFIDSTGLRSIVRARARAADRSAFVLRDPQGGTVRLLELSGLLDEFTIEPAPDRAPGSAQG
jgi:anti-sigma B factor antagonist